MTLVDRSHLSLHLSDSELRLERSPWNIIDTIWLLNAFIAWNTNTNSWHLSVTNKWHSATAIGSLWGHCVEAGHDSDDATEEEDESEPTDGDNAVEEDLVLWLPFDVAILVDLCRHAC